jgi:hypothetical protein
MYCSLLSTFLNKKTLNFEKIACDAIGPPTQLFLPSFGGFLAHSITHDNMLFFDFE